MLNSLTYLLLFKLAVFSGAVHPIHISKCQAEFNAENSELEIIVRVFMDDLELAISEEGIARDLMLGMDNEDDHADSAIETYLSNHLRIYEKKKRINVEFERKEISEDGLAFWIFLRTERISKPEGLKIEYDLHMELYDDQKNIFNIIHSDFREAYFLFTRQNRSFVVNFDD